MNTEQVSFHVESKRELNNPDAGRRPIPSIRAGCQRMTTDDYAIIFVAGQAFTVGALDGSGCLGRV